MFSQLRSLITKNWMAKLACLFIAISVWFWVDIQQTGTSTYEVPIEYTNVNDQLIIAEESSRVVKVSLEGPKTTLIRTDPSDLNVQLNLSQEDAGEKLFWARDLAIQHPENIKVASVRPRNVRVILEKRLTKTVPVQSTISSNPPPEFEYKTSVDPETATLIGPENTIKDIQRIPLPSQSLQNKTSDFSVADLEVKFPREVSLDYPSKNSFTLNIQISEKQITRQIKNIPVTVKNIPAGSKASVEPSEIDLKIQGPIRKVRSLTPDDITVTVKAPKKGSNIAIRVAEIDTPEDINIVNNNGDIPAFKVRLESL